MGSYKGSCKGENLQRVAEFRDDDNYIVVSSQVCENLGMCFKAQITGVSCKGNACQTEFKSEIEFGLAGVLPVILEKNHEK